MFVYIPQHVKQALRFEASTEMLNLDPQVSTPYITERYSMTSLRKSKVELRIFHAPFCEHKFL